MWLLRHLSVMRVMRTPRQVEVLAAIQALRRVQVKVSAILHHLLQTWQQGLALDACLWRLQLQYVLQLWQCMQYGLGMLDQTCLQGSRVSLWMLSHRPTGPMASHERMIRIVSTHLAYHQPGALFACWCIHRR